MIDAAAIGEILKMYDKHGWKLRRVLLSADLKASLNAIGTPVFEGADLTDSDIDATWFSRASDVRRETWEIRHLSETPFALLEVVDMAAGDSERDAILSGVENRLRQIVVAKRLSA